MTLDADLVARIDRAVAVYCAGTPIPPAELAAALAPLGLTADADYADFVARWADASWASPCTPETTPRSAARPAWS